MDEFCCASPPRPPLLLLSLSSPRALLSSLPVALSSRLLSLPSLLSPPLASSRLSVCRNNATLAALALQQLSLSQKLVQRRE